MHPFTHLDEQGQVRMVDVTLKSPTLRKAIAGGEIHMRPETLALIRNHSITKGNVLETARIAGIMAAKKTADLIPMCHPLNLTHAALDFELDPTASRIRIRAEVRTSGPTGVEMEALTAVATAALTIYDMCKSHDRGMRISELLLMEKSGGKSGTYRHSPA